MSAAESILEKFKSGAFDYQKAGDICRLLGTCSRSDREAVSRILMGLEEAGEIVQDERGRYVSPGRLGLVRGTVQGNERGFAFLLTEEGDLFLPRRALHGALHGDTVFAKRTGEQQAVDIDFGEFIELLGVLGPPVKAPPEPDRSKGFFVAFAGHVATSAQKSSGKGSGGDEFQCAARQGRTIFENIQSGSQPQRSQHPRG